jgi:hypothetical protein
MSDVVSIKYESCIGVYWIVNKEFFNDFKSKSKCPEKVIDIVVEIDGEKKQFSFDEFKLKLGF